MIWFVITDQKTDQTPNGKLSNLLAGTAEQITEKLKRYREAGMTMSLLWPPFADVPRSCPKLRQCNPGSRCPHEKSRAYRDLEDLPGKDQVWVADQQRIRPNDVREQRSISVVEVGD